MNNLHNWLECRASERSANALTVKCHEPRQLFTGRTFKHVKLNIHISRRTQFTHKRREGTLFFFFSNAFCYFVFYLTSLCSHTLDAWKYFHLAHWQTWFTGEQSFVIFTLGTLTFLLSLFLCWALLSSSSSCSRSEAIINYNTSHLFLGTHVYETWWMAE